MVFQSGNRGWTLTSRVCSMKALCGIGANRPERSRLPVMTWAISAPWEPPNAGMAMGSGLTSPRLMST